MAQASLRYPCYWGVSHLRLACSPPGKAQKGHPLGHVETPKTSYLYRANGRGGFGSQTAADLPVAVGSVTVSHRMLTLQPSFELSESQRCKERLHGPGKGVWVTSGSVSPKTAASVYTFFTGRQKGSFVKGWLSRMYPRSGFQCHAEGGATKGGVSKCERTQTNADKR